MLVGNANASSLLCSLPFTNVTNLEPFLGKISRRKYHGCGPIGGAVAVNTLISSLNPPIGKILKCIENMAIEEKRPGIAHL